MFLVSSFISNNFNSELLKKDKNERITIKDTLDHPWFVGANSAISEMRQNAMQGNNEMMKFISYSNVDAKVAFEAQKKSQGSCSPVGNYNAQSLLAPGQNQLHMLNQTPNVGNVANQ